MKIYSSAAYILPGIEGVSYTEHHIIRDVCEYFDVNADDIKKKRGEFQAKKRNWLLPRQVCMWFISKNYPNHTLKYIGSLFNRDHATVINAIKIIQNYIDTEPRFRIKIEEMHNIISTNRNLFADLKIGSIDSKALKYVIECVNNFTGLKSYYSLVDEVKVITSNINYAIKYFDRSEAKKDCKKLSKLNWGIFTCSVEKF